MLDPTLMLTITFGATSVLLGTSPLMKETQVLQIVSHVPLEPTEPSLTDSLNSVVIHVLLGTPLFMKEVQQRKIVFHVPLGPTELMMMVFCASIVHLRTPPSRKEVQVRQTVSQVS